MGSEELKAGQREPGGGVLEWLGPGVITFGAIVVLGRMAAPGEELWDAANYWTTGQGVLAAAALVSGAISPRAPWRWALLIAMAQVVSVAVYNGGAIGPLAPIGCGMALAQAIPLALVAYVGSWARQGLDRFARAVREAD